MVVVVDGIGVLSGGGIPVIVEPTEGLRIVASSSTVRALGFCSSALEGTPVARAVDERSTLRTNARYCRV